MLGQDFKDKCWDKQNQSPRPDWNLHQQMLIDLHQNPDGILRDALDYVGSRKLQVENIKMAGVLLCFVVGVHRTLGGPLSEHPALRQYSAEL